MSVAATIQIQELALDGDRWCKIVCPHGITERIFSAIAASSSPSQAQTVRRMAAAHRQAYGCGCADSWAGGAPSTPA
jgi:hypothetical protein